jgi:hypothetical protein
MALEASKGVRARPADGGDGAIGRERAPARRQLMRFLRFVAGGASRAQSDKAGTVLLICREQRLAVPDRLVRQALSRGLVVECAGRLTLDPAGRAFLRRAMIGAEGPLPDQPFQGQNRILEETVMQVEGLHAPVVVNLAESPLSVLARMKARDGAPFIDGVALLAGERLRADFTRGQLQQRVSANWEASVAGGTPRSGNGMADLTDAAIAARQRVERALSAVGPELSGVLVDVCCHLKGLEAVERERMWPARSAKMLLRSALGILSRHYGYRN